MSVERELEERTWLRDFAEAISCVSTDLVLRKHGYGLHFAVDFSEIFRYLHPEQQTSRTSDVPGFDHGIRSVVQERVALTFLFRGFSQPLVMLDPYLLELHDYIHSLASLASRTALRAKLLRSIAARLSPTDGTEAAEGIKQAITRLKAGLGITEADRDLLASYFQEKYRELWTVLTMPPPSVNAERARRLLHDQRLVHFATALPDVVIDREAEIAKCSGFLRQIERSLRRKSKSWRTNLVDAVACQYLQTLNEQLMPKGQLLVLITNDRTLLEVGKEQLSSSLPDIGSVQTVRSLTYVRALIQCRGRSGGEIDEQRVQHFMELSWGLLSLVESARSLADDKKAYRSLEQARSYLRDFNNLQSFLATNAALANEVENDLSHAPEFVRDLDSSLIEALGSNSALTSEIQARAEGLWRSARSVAVELEQGLGSNDPVRALRMRLGVRPARIARGQPEQLLYARDVVQTLQPPAAQIVRRFLESDDVGVGADGEQVSHWNQAAHQDPEAATAMSVIWAAYYEWDRAEKVSENAILMSSGFANRVNALHLLRRCIGQNKDDPKVGDETRRVVERLAEQGDPRALRERARLHWVDSIWTGDIDEKTLELSVEGRKVAARCVEDGLSALRLGALGELSTRLYNDLAWYYLFLDVSRAGQWVDRLQQQLSYHDMSADILDTLAMWQVKAGEVRIIETARALERAAWFLELALTKALYLPKWQRSIVTGHYDVIHARLGETGASPAFKRLHSGLEDLQPE